MFILWVLKRSPVCEQQNLGLFRGTRQVHILALVAMSTTAWMASTVDLPFQELNWFSKNWFLHPSIRWGILHWFFSVPEKDEPLSLLLAKEPSVPKAGVKGFHKNLRLYCDHFFEEPIWHSVDLRHSNFRRSAQQTRLDDFEKHGRRLFYPYQCMLGTLGGPYTPWPCSSSHHTSTKHLYYWSEGSNERYGHILRTLGNLGMFTDTAICPLDPYHSQL